MIEFKVRQDTTLIVIRLLSNVFAEVPRVALILKVRTYAVAVLARSSFRQGKVAPHDAAKPISDPVAAPPSFSNYTTE